MIHKQRIAKVLEENQADWPDIGHFENLAADVLAAIAEPSEAMIDGAMCAWYGGEYAQRTHMRKLMHLTLKAAHAAMMAEKDTGG